MAKRKTPSSLQPPPQHLHPSAGLLRRLGALLYDYLVVIALLIIAGFIGMGVARMGKLIQFIPYPVTTGFTIFRSRAEVA